MQSNSLRLFESLFKKVNKKNKGGFHCFFINTQIKRLFRKGIEMNGSLDQLNRAHLNLFLKIRLF